MPNLTARGRSDLVRVVEIKSKEFRKRLAWTEERDWKSAVKKFDREFLGNGLYRTCRSLRTLT